MISNPVELEAQRLQTDAFIRADPIGIILWRREKVPNGSGGFMLAPAQELPSQQFKLVPQNRQLEERQTVDGVVVRPDNVLIGYHNADIQRGDWFTNATGHRFEVVYVHEKRDYEVRADLVYRG